MSWKRRRRLSISTAGGHARVHAPGPVFVMGALGQRGGAEGSSEPEVNRPGFHGEALNGFFQRFTLPHHHGGPAVDSCHSDLIRASGGAGAGIRTRTHLRGEDFKCLHRFAAPAAEATVSKMSPRLGSTPGDCRGLQGTRSKAESGLESSCCDGGRAPSAA
jgi:hypothetical protein